MNETKKRSAQIMQQFSGLSTWEARYKVIIQLGKTSLPPLDTKYKISKWLIKGCQAQVWLYACQKNNKRVMFYGDSDALITKGLVALLLQYYCDLLPEEIIAHSVPPFFEKLDLKNHLTPTRVGGLSSMLRQIQYYAHVFLHLNKR